MSESTAPAPAPTSRGERLWLVCGLTLGALLCLLLARGFAGDAAKATPRLAKAFSDERWASVKDYAVFGSYWAAIAHSALLGLAALTAPLWHRAWHPPATAARPPAPAWFAAAMLAVLVLALGLRWTTATGGFWHDECLQMKRSWGSYVAGDPSAAGDVKYNEASWYDTWFHFRKPTNHTAIGVPARVCLTIWHRVTGSPRPAFAEWVVRLPSLLAGLGAIALTAWLGSRWLSPGAGLLGALLLAIHPWHVHWSVDARAYSIGIFACALGMAALTLARDRGGWLAWLLFGFAQFLLLWSSLMHLWSAFALFAVAAIGIVRLRRIRPPAPQWGRMLLANVLAAGLFFQAMGPNLIQFVQASKLRDPAAEEFMKLDAATGMDLLSHALLGLPHAVPLLPGDKPITTWSTQFAAAPAAGYALLAVSALLLTAGVMAVARRLPYAGWLLAALLLSGLVHLALTRAMDWYYYPRFSSYLLPAIVLGWAAFWHHAAQVLAPAGRVLRAAAIACGPVFLLATATPQLRNLATHPHEPFPELRDAFAAHRAAHGGRTLTACYGLGGDVLQEIYDPRCQFIHNAAQVRGLIDLARRDRRPLVIAYGLQAFNRHTVPDGFLLLDDLRLFTMIQRFSGNDPRHTFFLLSYTGAEP